MVIQHNIMALNAHRQFGGNTNTVAKNLEKLSSGYKINRAGDDAAGLAISEKMRAQIKGLDRAKLNAQDGISLVQTAEGALTETHSMLNRLVELATESANGTIQNDDRKKVQSEVSALLSEIDRISQATNFNGINLLDGSLEGGRVTSTQGAAAVGGTNAVTSFDMTTLVAPAASNPGLAAGDHLSIGGFDFTFTNPTAITSGADAMAQFVTAANGDTTFASKYTASYDAATNVLTLTAKNVGVSAAPVGGVSAIGGGALTGATIDGLAQTTAGTPPTTAATIGSTKVNFSDQPKAGTIMDIGGTKFEFIKAGGTAAAGNTGITLGVDLAATMASLQTAIQGNAAGSANIDWAGATVSATGEVVINAAAGIDTAPVVSFTGGGLTMQVGDTADAFNQVNVSIGDMSSAGLGLTGLSLELLDDSASALAKIKLGVETVSVARGTLGALQNRLEHTINNLGVTSENMTAAESRIRDVDMAKEMMDFTKNNVLTQAAQAMLAQANQQPQQVLQLLR